LRLRTASKFIIADISEPSAVQGELQAIDMLNTSVPIVPIINKTGENTLCFHTLQKQAMLPSPLSVTAMRPM